MLSVCHLHLVFGGYRMKKFHQFVIDCFWFFSSLPLLQAVPFICFSLFMPLWAIIFSLFLFRYIYELWLSFVLSLCPFFSFLLFRYRKLSTLSMLNICPWKIDSPHFLGMKAKKRLHLGFPQTSFRLFSNVPCRWKVWNSANKSDLIIVHQVWKTKS